MSYLYKIGNEFYKEMLSITSDDDTLANKRFQYCDYKIKDRTKYHLNRIFNYGEQYYSFFIHFINSYKIISYDLICECLLESSYEKIPKMFFMNDDKSLLNNYKEQEEQHLYSVIVKLITVIEVYQIFINLVNKYYINDFMQKVRPKGKLDSMLIKLLSKVNYQSTKLYLMNDSNFVHEHNSNDVLKIMLENNKIKHDYISEVVDSTEMHNLIIEEEKYYLEELERLIIEVEKKGNVTDLSSEKFEILRKFIFTFKENAYQRINQLQALEDKYKLVKVIKFN